MFDLSRSGSALQCDAFGMLFNKLFFVKSKVLHIRMSSDTD